MLGLASESWEAYQLDLACLQAGRWIENRLAETDDEGKPKHTLAALLGQETPVAKSGQEYAPLKPKGVRVMKVPESGVW